MIKQIDDPAFRKYGRTLERYDFSGLLAALGRTPAPPDTTVYTPSHPDFEGLLVYGELKGRAFGGMDIQIGYCNGVNSTLNCLEYHRTSEVNVTASNIILILGLQTDITNDFSYDTSNTETFFLPAGTGYELFATTLHFTPCCGEKDQPFRVACVLPRGTNSGLDTALPCGGEDKLLFKKNKWLLCHPDSSKAKEGAYTGLSGENITLVY